MEDDKTPFVEDGLLQSLERLFPDIAPELNQTDREIWVNRGAAGVVRHLRLLHKLQRENILGDTQDVF